jgi:hypothetical protein
METKERIKKIEAAAGERLLEAIDSVISAENALTGIKGLEGVGKENITDCFEWKSLRFRGEHPELYSETISPGRCDPADYLAEILAEGARRSIPNMFSLKGVSVRLKPTLYEFQISGSISEDDFEKFSGLREEWYGLEDGNRSDK